MTCGEVQDLVEAVASGDVTPGPEFAAHLAGCRSCQAALAAAVRIEGALAGLPAPAAPAGFIRAVAAATRRQRWQQEEHVDRAFNVSLAIGVVIMTVAVVSLFNVASVAQMLMVAIDTVSAIPQESPWAAAPSIPAAGLTAAVVATTIALWWWAERRSDYQDQ
jgi:hypothetical protein